MLLKGLLAVFKCDVITDHRQNNDVARCFDISIQKRSVFCAANDRLPISTNMKSSRKFLLPNLVRLCLYYYINYYSRANKS